MSDQEPEAAPDQGAPAHSSDAERLTRLIRGLAHDFNNLLAIISGNIQLARDRAVDAQMRTFLDEAEMASAMAAELIARLKSVAMDLPMRLVPLDPLSILRDAEPTLRAACGPAIAIGIAGEQDIPAIRTDRLAFLNAILNLVINARDAMPSGGTIAIRVANTKTEVGSSAVAIRIADTGTGMPPNILQRAFDPYFSTKDPSEGRGMGLASVHGFARQCGGSASLESTPGQGTCVTLLLPAAGDPSVRSCP